MNLFSKGIKRLVSCNDRCLSWIHKLHLFFNLFFNLFKYVFNYGNRMSVISKKGQQRCDAHFEWLASILRCMVGRLTMLLKCYYTLSR